MDGCLYIIPGTVSSGNTSPAAFKSHGLHVCIKDARDEGLKFLSPVRHLSAHLTAQLIPCSQQLPLWQQSSCRRRVLSLAS